MLRGISSKMNVPRAKFKAAVEFNLQRECLFGKDDGVPRSLRTRHI